MACLTKGHAELEWAHILDDLDGLQEIELTVQGKGYRLRTETKGTISAVFGALWRCAAARAAADVIVTPPSGLRRTRRRDTTPTQRS